MIVLMTFIACLFVQDAAPSKTAVDELIQRMGSDSAEVRSKALDDLKKMGKRAVPWIKEALPEVKDPEIRARINHLLRTLEPPALVALQEYLEHAKVDVAAMDVVKDDAVSKTLPELIFFQVWQRGQAACWKVLGYDTPKKELFDTGDAAAWAGYIQDPKRDAIAVQKAEHQIKVAAAAPHASFVAYPSAPTLRLYLKDESRAFWVKADGHTLEARSIEGKPLWTVDVEPICGGNVGSPVVRFLTKTAGNLNLVYGKHSYATLDPDTGKVLGSGSD